MEEIQNVHKVFVGKPKEEDHLVSFGVERRIILKLI
jgi:hypothetical protein